MPSRRLNERKSLTAKENVGFDRQGYVVAEDPDDDGKIYKADENSEYIAGVNYVSTRHPGRHKSQRVLEGIEVAVHHDGYPNALADEGTYTGGDAVYVSNVNDGYITTDAENGGVKVGNVVTQAGKTVTEEDEGYELVQVDITSNTGEP